MSATVTSRPAGTLFACDFSDYVISSTASITFKMYCAGKLILSEQYAPDNENTITVRGLAEIIKANLYGKLDIGGQPNLVKTFEVKIDGTTDFTYVITAGYYTVTGACAAADILSRGTRDTCIPGQPHYLTFTGDAIATAYDSHDAQLASISLNTGTVDCDPAALFASCFGNARKITYEIEHGRTFTSYVDHNKYADQLFTFRFLNAFDAPQCVTARNGVSLKPSITDTVSHYRGVDTKFDVQADDEFTASSGMLFVRNEYDIWHDLMTSRKAEVLHTGRWIPILVQKPSYTQELRQSSYGEIQFNFKMARQRDNGVISL